MEKGNGSWEWGGSKKYKEIQVSKRTWKCHLNMWLLYVYCIKFNASSWNRNEQNEDQFGKVGVAEPKPSRQPRVDSSGNKRDQNRRTAKKQRRTDTPAGNWNRTRATSGPVTWTSDRTQRELSQGAQRFIGWIHSAKDIRRLFCGCQCTVSSSKTSSHLYIFFKT